MPIPPVILDDLTWSDLTTAARGRIPAASNGRWTLHAPVDPGITLLELHAWLLEQRLYWMNQVPDSLSRGALALLGEAAEDAQCATTVLQFNFDSPQPATARLAAGTAMTLVDSDPPLIFSLASPVTILPLASPRANVVLPCPAAGIAIGDNTDRSAELAAGLDICLFADAGAEVAITLNLAKPPAPSAGDAISLAFLLDSDGDDVPAEWSAAAVSVPPPARLSWWYATAGGKAPFAAAAVSDGTGGLRRSGIVRLKLPADWQPGATSGSGPLPYTLYLRAESAAFAAPPRLVGLWPNAVIARHQRGERRRLTTDWLPLPGIAITLADEELPPLIDGTRLRLRERDGNWHWWLPTADLAFHGREDRVFVVDRAGAALRFGNGETGRVPVPGWSFGVADLADDAALARTMQASARAIDAYLAGELPAAARALLSALPPGQKPSATLRRAMLAALDAAVNDAGLYQTARFQGVTLDAALLASADPAPGGLAQQRINRLLLQAAYPQALRAAKPAALFLSIGGGEAGNVGALCDWEPASPAPGSAAPLAVNLVAGAGGAEPEAFADARRRVAASLKRADRAVIAADFESLACTTPGIDIRRAHAAIGYHPDFPCRAVPGAVTVFVLPDAARPAGTDTACARVVAPVPDAPALAAVAARLDVARLLTSEIYVRPPLYRRVAITVDVQGNPAAPDQLRADIAAALGDFLDPLIGGDDGTGWPFGEKLRPSALLRVAETAAAERAHVVGLSIRLLDVSPPSDESCQDVAIGAHGLVALDSVTTRIAAPPTVAGGLL